MIATIEETSKAVSQAGCVKHLCAWCKRYYLANREGLTIYVEAPADNTVASHGCCKPCRLKFFPRQCA